MQVSGTAPHSLCCLERLLMISVRRNLVSLVRRNFEVAGIPGSHVLL